ncbi:hypothetical protein DAPPUDRAFT_257353 [Daphnia pulex]|uniref:Uncharacterized protein n=1 Tax=Daphnia pulex TaxID=6669 RepID=E9HDE2_DAPPU|nr:hypothetical protein DAPPUDRAFT_257353 [Daphnia pulex]|eukprot:EFX70263.1 hypothetical protein DAPPUDRAFT_257353 [Daphnia pulex]
MLYGGSVAGCRILLVINQEVEEHLKNFSDIRGMSDRLYIRISREFQRGFQYDFFTLMKYN